MADLYGAILQALADPLPGATAAAAGFLVTADCLCESFPRVGIAGNELDAAAGLTDHNHSILEHEHLVSGRKARPIFIGFRANVRGSPNFRRDGFLFAESPIEFHVR